MKYTVVRLNGHVITVMGY